MRWSGAEVQDVWSQRREVQGRPVGAQWAVPVLLGVPVVQLKGAEEVCSYQSVKVCNRKADFFYIALFFHYCKRKTCLIAIFLEILLW